DLEIALEAVVHLESGDRPRLRAALPKLRDPLPAGRERQLLDAAILLSGGDAPSASVVALLADRDPRVVAMALRASAPTRRETAEAAPLARDLLAGHAGPIVSVAFAPDGKTFVTAGQDRALMFWDADRGTLKRIVEGHSGKILCMPVRPD